MIAILPSSLKSFSQNANLEFVENKGQWENDIKFKGVMNNGAFFLQEKGFTIVQHNSEDLQALADVFHGIAAISESTASKISSVTQQRNPVTLRSHAYTVQFLNAST